MRCLFYANSLQAAASLYGSAMGYGSMVGPQVSTHTHSQIPMIYDALSCFAEQLLIWSLNRRSCRRRWAWFQVALPFQHAIFTCTALFTIGSDEHLSAAAGAVAAVDGRLYASPNALGVSTVGLAGNAASLGVDGRLYASPTLVGAGAFRGIGTMF